MVASNPHDIIAHTGKKSYVAKSRGRGPAGKYTGQHHPTAGRSRANDFAWIASETSEHRIREMLSNNTSAGQIGYQAFNLLQTWSSGKMQAVSNIL